MDIYRAINGAPKLEKIAMLFIFLGGMVQQVNIACLPLWFMDPKLDCWQQTDASSIFDNNNPNNIYVPCSKDAACQLQKTDINLVRFSANSPKSLLSEFGMYCGIQNDMKKASYLSFLILAQPVPPIIFSAWIVKPSYRGFLIATCFVVSGILSLYSILSYDLMTILINLFFVRVFLRSFFTHQYVYMNENFSKDLAKIAPALTNSSWGVYSIVLSIFHYFFPYWRVLMLYCAVIPFIVLGVAQIWFLYSCKFYPTPKDDLEIISLRNVVAKNATESEVKGNLWELLHNRNYVVNCAIFTFIYRVGTMAFLALAIILSKFYGGLYINLIIYGTIEIFASWVAGFFIQKFKGVPLLAINCAILSILFLSFGLQYWIGTNNTYFNVYLLIALMTIKFGVQCLFAFTISLIDNFVPLKFHQVFWSISCVCDIIQLFVPYIIAFFFDVLNVHPFVFFGVCLVLGCYLCKHFHIIGSSEPKGQLSEAQLVNVPNYYATEYTMPYGSVQVLLSQLRQGNNNIELQKAKEDRMQQIIKHRLSAKKDQELTKQLLENEAQE